MCFCGSVSSDQCDRCQGSCASDQCETRCPFAREGESAAIEVSGEEVARVVLALYFGLTIRCSQRYTQ